MNLKEIASRNDAPELELDTLSQYLKMPTEAACKAAYISGYLRSHSLPEPPPEIMAELLAEPEAVTAIVAAFKLGYAEA